jgi:hypothetical protein
LLNNFVFTHLENSKSEFVTFLNNNIFSLYTKTSNFWT